MTTTTAALHGYKCPICNEELTEDPSNKGFVRHKTNSGCTHEKGERDPVRQQTDVASTQDSEGK